MPGHTGHVNPLRQQFPQAFQQDFQQQQFMPQQGESARFNPQTGQMDLAPSQLGMTTRQRLAMGLQRYGGPSQGQQDPFGMMSQMRQPAFPGMGPGQSQFMPLQQQVQQMFGQQQMSPFGQMFQPQQQMSPFGMPGGQPGMMGMPQQASPFGQKQLASSAMQGQMPGMNPQNFMSGLSFMQGLPGFGGGGFGMPFGRMNMPQQFQGQQRFFQ